MYCFNTYWHGDYIFTIVIAIPPADVAHKTKLHRSLKARKTIYFIYCTQKLLNRLTSKFRLFIFLYFFLDLFSYHCAMQCRCVQSVRRYSLMLSRFQPQSANGHPRTLNIIFFIAYLLFLNRFGCFWRQLFDYATTATAFLRTSTKSFFNKRIFIQLPMTIMNTFNDSTLIN